MGTLNAISNFPAICVPSCNTPVLTTSKKKSVRGRSGAENPLLALQFEDQKRILGLVDRHLLLGNHKELVSARTEPHKGGFPVEPAVEAPPTSHQVEHGEARVAADGEGELSGRVNGEVGDSPFVGRNGLEEDEGVGVEDGDRAVLGGREEVEGEGEGGGGEEGEGGGGGRGGGEGGDLGGGWEVVELDGVVGSSGGRDGASDGDGTDWGEVGGVGEDLGEGEVGGG